MWNSYKFKVFLTDNSEKNNISFILLTLSGFLYPIQRLKKLKKETK
jgi:hypothetical protein